MCLRKSHLISVRSLLGVPVSRFPPIASFAYLFSVTTFGLVHTAGWNQKSPMRLSSMGWNVWLSGQSDSRQRNEVHRPKSEGCRSVDSVLGGGAQKITNKVYHKKSSRSRRIAQRRRSRKCCSSNGLSRMAIKERMTWPKTEQCWMDEKWHRLGPAQFSKEGMRNSRLCSVQPINKNREAERHRTEWCAGTSTYLCMRCERSSKNMRLPGKCEGSKWMMGTDFSPIVFFWRGGRRILGDHDTVRGVEPIGEALVWCRKWSACARCRCGN